MHPSQATLNTRIAASAVIGAGGITDSKELDRVLRRLREVATNAHTAVGDLNNIVTRAGTPYTLPQPCSDGDDSVAPDPIGALPQMHHLLDSIERAQAAQRREIDALAAFV